MQGTKATCMEAKPHQHHAPRLCPCDTVSLLTAPSVVAPSFVALMLLVACTTCCSTRFRFQSRPNFGVAIIFATHCRPWGAHRQQQQTTHHEIQSCCHKALNSIRTCNAPAIHVCRAPKQHYCGANNFHTRETGRPQRRACAMFPEKRIESC